MDLLAIVQINCYAFLILLIIYFNSRKMKEKFFAHKIFMSILKINIVLIIFDVLSRIFDGKLGSINIFLNIWFNSLLFICAVIPAGLWLLFVDFQIYNDQKRISKIKTIVNTVIFANLIITVLTIPFGWYYNLDRNNVYHRGPYFSVHMLFSYGFLFYTSIFIILNRKRIEKKYYISLLLFPMPMFIASILQVHYYGTSFIWSSMVLSILIVYFSIQDVSLNTDYLTGVFNRRRLDLYLKEKINSNRDNKTFSAILIDMDNFKRINDEYGHIVGDEALKVFAALLRTCLKDEFIARYGGDEFIIILDISSKDRLLETAENLKNMLINYSFNDINLDFSMGYDVYDNNANAGPIEFLKHLDKLMYINKEAKRKANNAS